MSRSATGGPSKEIYNPSNPTAHSGPAQQPGTPSPLSHPAGSAPGHPGTPIPHGPECWVGAWVFLGTGVGVWGVGNVLHAPCGMGTLRGMGTGGFPGSVLSCEHHGLAMDTQWHVLAPVHTLVHADTRTSTGTRTLCRTHSVQQVVPYSPRYSQACPATLTHTPLHTSTPSHCSRPFPGHTPSSRNPIRCLQLGHAEQHQQGAGAPSPRTLRGWVTGCPACWGRLKGGGTAPGATTMASPCLCFPGPPPPSPTLVGA